LISYVRIVHNPKDELAWNRLLMFIEGIGPKTSQGLFEEIKECSSLKEVALGVCANKGKVYKYSASLKKLGDFLESIEGQPLPLAQLCEAALQQYYPILKTKFDDWDSRLKDLEAVEAIAQQYHAIGDFLADFAIEPPDGLSSAAQAVLPEHQRPLTLSTIHSAKGLEWEYVFMIGLIDGILPVSFALQDAQALEEERRLFYVGITRAKEELCLSLHQQGEGFGALAFDRVSRFIDVSEVLEKVKKIWYRAGDFGYDNE
jgi:DNA helicase II / ATP-dependent DNA helicase PcrA